MKEPGVTCGGPAGRRLAVGSQAGVACAAADTASRCARSAVTAVDPGTAQAAIAAASSSGVSRSQAGGFTGTPPAAE